MEGLNLHRVALVETALSGLFQLEGGPVLDAVVALLLQEFEEALVGEERVLG